MEYTNARNGRSVLPQECIDEILAIIDDTRDVEGCIVEAGSFRCGTAMEMALRNEYKIVYALDSFGGKNAMKEFSQSDLAEVLEYTKDQKNLTIMQGDICQLVSAVKGPVSLALLDCDEYEPTLAALKALSPIVSEGGKIIVDDFEFYGVVKAFAAWDSTGWSDEALPSGLVVYTKVKK